MVPLFQKNNFNRNIGKNLKKPLFFDVAARPRAEHISKMKLSGHTYKNGFLPRNISS